MYYHGEEMDMCEKKERSEGGQIKNCKCHDKKEGKSKCSKVTNKMKQMI